MASNTDADHAQTPDYDTTTDSDRGSYYPDEWLGQFADLTVHTSPIAGEPPILELHGDEKTAAIVADGDGALVDILTEAAAEVNLLTADGEDYV